MPVPWDGIGIVASRTSSEPTTVSKPPGGTCPPPPTGSDPMIFFPRAHHQLDSQRPIHHIHVDNGFDLILTGGFLITRIGWWMLVVLKPEDRRNRGNPKVPPPLSAAPGK